MAPSPPAGGPTGRRGRSRTSAGSEVRARFQWVIRQGALVGIGLARLGLLVVLLLSGLWFALSAAGHGLFAGLALESAHRPTVRTYPPADWVLRGIAWVRRRLGDVAGAIARITRWNQALAARIDEALSRARRGLQPRLSGR